jgi:hypothetical protein
MRSSTLLALAVWALCALVASCHFEPHPLDKIQVENIEIKNGTGVSSARTNGRRCES